MIFGFWKFSLFQTIGQYFRAYSTPGELLHPAAQLLTHVNFFVAIIILANSEFISAFFLIYGSSSFSEKSIFKWGVLASHNLAPLPLEELKNSKNNYTKLYGFSTALWNTEKKIPKSYPYSTNQPPLINKFQKSENNYITTFYGYFMALWKTENKWQKPTSIREINPILLTSLRNRTTTYHTYFTAILYGSLEHRNKFSKTNPYLWKQQ